MFQIHNPYIEKMKVRRPWRSSLPAAPNGEKGPSETTPPWGYRQLSDYERRRCKPVVSTGKSSGSPGGGRRRHDNNSALHSVAPSPGLLLFLPSTYSPGLQLRRCARGYDSITPPGLLSPFNGRLKSRCRSGRGRRGSRCRLYGPGRRNRNGCRSG